MIMMDSIPSSELNIDQDAYQNLILHMTSNTINP